MTIYTATTAMLMATKTPPKDNPPARVVRKPTREECKGWEAKR